RKHSVHESDRRPRYKDQDRTGAGCGKSSISPKGKIDHQYRLRGADDECRGPISTHAPDSPDVKDHREATVDSETHGGRGNKGARSVRFCNWLEPEYNAHQSDSAGYGTRDEK